MGVSRITVDKIERMLYKRVNFLYTQTSTCKKSITGKGLLSVERTVGIGTSPRVTLHRIEDKMCHLPGRNQSIRLKVSRSILLVKRCRCKWNRIL